MSTAGGTEPRWRPDGHELFFRAADNRLTVTEVNANSAADFDVKHVAVVFGPVVASYDVSVDGQRFLTRVPAGGDADTPLTVVQNWTTALTVVPRR